MHILTSLAALFLATQVVVAFPQLLDTLSPLQRARLTRGIKRQNFGSDMTPRFEADPPSLAKRYNVGGLDLPLILIPGQLFPIVVSLPGVVTVGRKIIPDAAHPYVAPTLTDQRGGCPGLNLMANYGYISHTGITNVGELLYGLQEMLGLSLDLAAVLVAFTFRGMTDITTLKMSIGLTDSRTSGLLTLLFGQAPGLFSPASHTKYEIDGSLAYADNAFAANGNGNNFNSTLWTRNEEIAAAGSGLFDLDFVKEARLQAYNACVQTNPSCSWLAVGQILFYGAECFTFLTMPSTGTDGHQEPATPAVVRAFSGIQANPNGSFSKIPERVPTGSTGPWYRRATPLTTLEIAQAAVNAYVANPVAFGVNSNGINSFVVSGTQLNPETVTAAAVGCLLLGLIVEDSPILANAFVTALVAPARLAFGCS